MTPITEHFKLEDLTRTNTRLPNSPRLALMGNIVRLAGTLESVYQLLGSLKINSGYRSEAVNSVCGGVRTSAHLFGRAADFVPIYVELQSAFDAIRLSCIEFDQLILESTWIHIGLASVQEKSRRESLIATQGDHGTVYRYV